jgi:hypothetical protein
VPRPRTIFLALLPFALHGLAREVDRALGLVLRAEMEPAGLLVEIARAMGAEGPGGTLRIVAWLLGGLGVWLALGWWRSRSTEAPLVEALSGEVPTFAPLFLRPALTFVAVASVALRPSFPYAFTLPVALTQDLGVGQDVAVLAALLALRLPPLRMPVPGPRAIFLLSFLGYALLTPEWARQWEGHPGNEPKYLRMAVALGHDLTLDAEGVSAAMEDLPTTPLGQALVAAGSRLGRESWHMAVAVARGEAGRNAIRATRITRQTIRGKEGGVYYVLAPGPSLILAPTFRIDRALNRARGTAGPIPVSVLAWNALAALLVVAVFVLARDAIRRPGMAAALAFLFALLPPFLFYFFQFYPEMPGALVLAVAFHALALRPERLGRHPWLYGWMLATLPWLHQKFLPVWLVLAATALWVMWRQSGATPSPSDGESPGPVNGEILRRTLDDEAPQDDSPQADDGARVHEAVPWGWLVAFLIPQAVSLFLTALYNFAVAGSVRPDALFLAWGPGGVTTARMGQGVLGILLDARYGILPYVPLLVLGAAGLVLGGARRFAVVLPAAAVYYLTVASADNWAGAVCNLGRYFMPVAPLAIALVAVALARVSGRRGALALGLILAVWSAAFALALWQDPRAANDSALLLAKSTYADPNQYIPNLHLRTWARAAPGLWARVGAWIVVMGVSTLWWRRAAAAAAVPARGESTKSGASPSLTLFATLAVLLAFAFTLEQWPARRRAPSFRDTLAVGPEARAFAGGEVRVRPDEVVAGPGAAGFLVRSPDTRVSLPMTVGGEGVIRVRGLRPFVLRPTGARVDLPLRPYHVVHGRSGRRAVFARMDVIVEGQAVLRPAPHTGERVDTPGAEEERNHEAVDLVER